jgi:hypothetical protein
MTNDRLRWLIPERGLSKLFICHFVICHFSFLILYHDSFFRRHRPARPS